MPLNRGSPDARIAGLAAGQHGVVTRAQLLEAGLTSGEVRTRRASGRLVPLHRGVYLLGELRGRFRPPRSAEMAAVLACGRGALVSHRTGAWLWRLVSRPGPSAPIEVTVPPDRCPARRRGIRAHRAFELPQRDVAAVEGVPVTSVGRTLCDLAASATRRDLERAVARAEREGLIEMGELEERVARLRGRPGVRLLRLVISGGVAYTRSEVEHRFHELIRGTGIPGPGVNVVIHGYEVDFLWREQRLAVEIDGFAYHRSRESFARDRRRDAELFTAAGITVLRFTWEQIVHEPKRTLVTLARAMERTAG